MARASTDGTTSNAAIVPEFKIRECLKILDILKAMKRRNDVIRHDVWGQNVESIGNKGIDCVTGLGTQVTRYGNHRQANETRSQVMRESRANPG